MDSIAVTKPNMAVLSQERLALSPFGALAQSFAEELMARAGQEEGYWSFVPLELLQEVEESPVSPVPPAQTVLQFNLKLVLDALRKDRPNTEYLRATERIVERIVQRQEVQREAARSVPAAAAAVAPAATAQAALRFQQNIMQTLHQTFLFRRPDGYRAGEGFRQQPGAAAGETGRPGQLGQKTAVFTQMLQTLREEGKSFPAQQAAEQTAIPAQRPKYPAAGDQTLPPLTHLEEGEQAAETAQQGGAQAAKRLIQTAEQLERKLRQKDVRPTKTQTIQQTQHTPVSQHTGPEQGHDLPKFSARQGGEPTGSLHTLEPPSLKEQSEISHAVERAVRTAETLLPQMETQRQTSAKPLAEQPPGKEARTATAKDIRTVIPDSDNQESRPEQHRADFLPSEELTHRQEEPGSEATAPPTAMTQPHSAQPHAEAGQKVTARDIRAVISESGEQASQPEQRLGELLPGEELTHRQEEPGSEATTPPTAMTQPHSAQPHVEAGQKVTARDIRTVISESGEQASQPEQRLGEILPGEELTHRQEEPGNKVTTPPTAMTQPHSAQPHVEAGQKVTARDIRTVIPESGEQATQPEQRMGELLPGEELTHRQEEQSREAATPPRAMIQPVPVQPHTEPGQKVTARDIRTVISESGEQTTQPEQRQVEFHSDIELTHRAEEQKAETTQAAAQSQPHTAKEIHSAAGAGVTAQENRQYKRKVKSLSSLETDSQKEKETNQTAQISGVSRSAGKIQPTTARDIRTAVIGSAGREGNRDQSKAKVLSGDELIHRLEGQSEEYLQLSAASRTMETQFAQGTLSGEELTLKTEQSTAAPPPAEVFERAAVGQQVSVGKPIAGTLQGDIRIGQRLIGRSNLPPETGNRRGIPSAAVPSLALEYGTHVQGQQGEQPPVPAQNDAWQTGNTAGQQPLELTYSPGQQAVSQVQPPVQAQAPQPPEESDSVRSLPDWARRFLRDSWTAAPAAQEIGVARQIAMLPEQSTEMVEWSAPNYKPNIPLEHREKRKEERPQKPQQIHLSEAEIQRAADRVYRILEDRIREERIRLGF
ncbi:hypothetical protein [Pseudoflavonifractor phocaeensis]|uniref:hypothetical protein n=1 Tax=Pseudoflavonifractor phocaeensis TaxID=1870988 RepID=UPI00195EA088|nr:hypothetical protein [Pseudoflavonifractor phocaeensis]MBM6884955.1 hypothetical protein [Pseudoflavonifractor phocaeensis]